MSPASTPSQAANSPDHPARHSALSIDVRNPLRGEAIGRLAAGFGYVPSLDGLRAVAVLAVMLVHANAGFGYGGWIGVDIFFVLSGFLITSIILKEVVRTGRFDLRRFYLNRALRLYPALVVFVISITCFALLTEHNAEAPRHLQAGVFALLYVSNWATALDWVYMGNLQHTWSLAIEEQFYLVWPLVLVMALRRSRSPKLVFVAACVPLLASVVVRALVFNGSEAETSWRTYAGFDTRADSLLIGCLLALVMSSVKIPFTRISAELCSIASTAVIISLVFQLSLGQAYGALANYGGYTLIAMVAALLIASLVSEPQSLMARVLSMKPMLWIGQRSYAIYLWHLPLFSRFHDRPTVVTIAICIVATFVLAELSYRFVEQPFLRRKNGWVTSGSGSGAQR